MPPAVSILKTLKIIVLRNPQISGPCKFKMVKIPFPDMDHPSKFSAQNGKLKSSEFYPNKMMYLGVYVWAPTETLVKNELKQLTMAKTREWAAV